MVRPSKEAYDEVLGILEKRGIHFKRSSLLAYLRSFPDMIRALPAAISSAQKYFPDAELALDLYEDPEFDDSYLVLSIKPQSYDNLMWKHLEAAEEEFFPFLENREGWIQLTII